MGGAVPFQRPCKEWRKMDQGALSQTIKKDRKTSAGNSLRLPFGLAFSLSRLDRAANMALFSKQTTVCRSLLDFLGARSHLGIEHVTSIGSKSKAE